MKKITTVIIILIFSMHSGFSQGKFDGGIGMGYACDTLQGVPLPILLIDFNAHVVDGKAVLIDWATANELNNEYFEIERSKDLIGWVSVGQINSGVNSTTKRTYDLIDHFPFNGISYYRLKQVDFTKDFTYSDVVSVEIEDGLSVEFFPNPFEDVLNIKGDLGKDGMRFQIFNLLGKAIYEGMVKSGELDLKALYPGVYLISIGDQIERIIKK